MIGQDDNRDSAAVVTAVFILLREFNAPELSLTAQAKAFAEILEAVQGIHCKNCPHSPRPRWLANRIRIGHGCGLLAATNVNCFTVTT
jgi:hypothetical protein